MYLNLWYDLWPKQVTLVSCTQHSGPLCNVSFCKREEKIKCIDILLNVHTEKWVFVKCQRYNFKFWETPAYLPTPKLCSPEWTQTNHFLGKQWKNCLFFGTFPKLADPTPPMGTLMWILAKFRNENVNLTAKNNGHQNFTEISGIPKSHPSLFRKYS